MVSRQPAKSRQCLRFKHYSKSRRLAGIIQNRQPFKIVFLVSEIATIYSPRFTCSTVQSASKQSCTASKFAQRRTSNKRFKFVRFALWDGVPPPLNLVVRPTPLVFFVGFVSFSISLSGFHALRYSAPPQGACTTQFNSCFKMTSSLNNRQAQINNVTRSARITFSAILKNAGGSAFV